MISTNEDPLYLLEDKISGLSVKFVSNKVSRLARKGCWKSRRPFTELNGVQLNLSSIVPHDRVEPPYVWSCFLRFVVIHTPVPVPVKSHDKENDTTIFRWKVGNFHSIFFFQPPRTDSAEFRPARETQIT